MNKLIIRGGREHNLKNISVEIPKNKFVVVTGVSGSGKSSLAFDTIYAEGQRRYVESLSAYARQFLGIMSKPDVDLIEGLSPAISIDQKTVSHNPRSTVGTITEVYDYLRLLFARVGHPHCPNCNLEISRLSVDEIIQKIIKKIKNNLSKNKIKPFKFSLLSPIVRDKKGEFKDLFSNLKAKGYSQVIVDNKKINLDKEEIGLIKTNKHKISVIIDSFSLRYKEFKDDIFQSNFKSRLSLSIEQSLNLSDGLVILRVDDKKKTEYLFSEKFCCSECGLSLPELEPRMFSFNSPIGACKKCKGIGTVFKIDPDLILKRNLTINEGGILPFANIFNHDTWYVRLLKTVSKIEKIDFDVPIKDIPKKKLDKLLVGTGKVYRVKGTNRFGKETVIFERFKGLVYELERRYFERKSNRNDYEIGRYLREEKCFKCQGDRLKPEILAVTLDGLNISQMTDLSINDFYPYFKEVVSGKLTEFEKEVSRPILKEIITRLSFLYNVGLGYLTLSRKAKTLSGGEAQRIRLASQIGTGLSGVLYVLDEPSIGLHPRDVSALISSLKSLKKIGNTLIVVEHDRETMESADYLIELGPYAGKKGGKVVFQGTVKEIIKKNKTLTGYYLSGKKTISYKKRALVNNRGIIKLVGASLHNLKKIDIKIPLGNLIVVTGVSGSGKSTLISETLYPGLKYYLEGYYQKKIGGFSLLQGYQYLERVYLVNQSPIGRTPRSNSATYIGFFDDIRDLFSKTIEAKARGFSKSRFSFNVKGGRCEKCSGGGVLKIEMQFLADVFIKCDLCKGERYNQETLDIKYKGKNISDILKMTVDEAVLFFSNHPKINKKLMFLKDVGLGYIELGQSAPTFSGGEAQRIKLANELSRRESGKTLYILDEPTTGLHFYDIEKLLNTLYKLVDRGNTVVIIEHNLDVIKNCQYVIDLGLEGGDKGGNVVFQGQLESLLKAKDSYTGKYLKRILKNSRDKGN